MTNLPTINRMAVVLLRTEACLDWIKSVLGSECNLTLDALQREPTVYLIPENGDPESYIRLHFKEMFEEELDSCHTDADSWARAMTFENFKKFFTIRVSTVVYDLDEGSIVKEVITE
jgi:hypothetical protein